VKDYYAVLHVDHDASPADIRKAFRDLARTSHPDTNFDDPAAEEAFKEINEAHRVLRDPTRRERYDLELGISRGRGFYAAPEPTGGTPVAAFAAGTPLQGMRIVRRRDQLLLDDAEEMAAVAVLEFDRLGQLLWESSAERDWVVAQAAGARPGAAPRPGPAPRGASTTAADGGPARPAGPRRADVKARDLVRRARRASERGRFEAALKLLRRTEPSARLADAEVARGIAEVAQAVRGRVSGPARKQCDELLAQVRRRQTGAAARTPTTDRGPRGSRADGPLSWLRRRSASRS
jgi:curved DNA-binding protein CbpA